MNYTTLNLINEYFRPDAQIRIDNHGCKISNQASISIVDILSPTLTVHSNVYIAVYTICSQRRNIMNQWIVDKRSIVQ